MFYNLQFRKEKEKSENNCREEEEKLGKGFSTFEKKKRNEYYFLKNQEEKENFYQTFLKVFPFSKALPIML